MDVIVIMLVILLTGIFSGFFNRPFSVDISFVGTSNHNYSKTALK